MDISSNYRSDYCGSDNVANYNEGQIKQLQKIEIQRIWELLLEARKKTGHEDLGGHLVDVGCGCGDMTSMLVEHFDSATGIDISPEQIMRAKETCTDPSIEFFVGKGEKLPLASSSADAVTAIFSIHYMDMNAFTSECLRVLKPGGVAVFWTDNWGGIRSVDGRHPDATHLVQDMKRDLREILQKKSHYPSISIIDLNKSRFKEITVTEKKSLHSGEIEVIVSLAEFKKLIFAIPVYHGLCNSNPINTLGKRLKALWKMEEVSDDDIIFRGIRDTFPIVIWK